MKYLMLFSCLVLSFGVIADEMSTLEQERTRLMYELNQVEDLEQDSNHCKPICNVNRMRMKHELQVIEQKIDRLKACSSPKKRPTP